jgi:RNA polymerase sigma-70 factor (ECF subfamily)
VPDYAQLTDGELLVRAAKGDEQAFAALYRRRSVAVYRFALGMTGSREAAEEVVQETFLALIENPAGFNAGRGELASYLYGVARNRALRRFRRLGEAVALDDEPQEGDEAGMLEALEAKDRLEALQRALLGLPEAYREAVVLCDIEELSYAEAAEALGTAVGTVRSRLHRGRTLLARKMGVAPAKIAKETT